MENRLCKCYCATCIGLEVVKVTVEVSVTDGVGLFIVGLPDNAVREALLRVTTAMQRNGYRIPGRRIVINMAPANIRKAGSGYDAAIAIGLLAASGQIREDGIEDCLIVGELSLDGRLRRIPGILAMAVRARGMGFSRIVVPAESMTEASWVHDLTVTGVENLKEAASAVSDSGFIGCSGPAVQQPREDNRSYEFDFKDVRGQEFARRGMEIAASGSHNVLLVGPPGSGKSMLSKCLPSVLPPMTREESLETSMIYSVAGMLDGSTGLVSVRPFRSPHHSASMVSMIGGGAKAMPGEISLAHNGVLCLDEIAHFRSEALEVLRQPLEDHRITISRAGYKVDYPASFMLVASMNPCPCGYAGDGTGRCTCAPGMISRYTSRVSGPLLDRIDLRISVRISDMSEVDIAAESESSAVMAERVAAAREIQSRRFAGTGILCNSGMPNSMVAQYCVPDSRAMQLLEKISGRYCLSARGYFRLLKVARTIADMEASEHIKTEHISEAVQYRFPENV